MSVQDMDLLYLQFVSVCVEFVLVKCCTPSPTPFLTVIKRIKSLGVFVCHDIF